MKTKGERYGQNVAAAQPSVARAWPGASHIVSLHLPLLPQTHHLINAERIGGMRPGAYLINMSRCNIKEKPGLEDATSLIRFAVRWGESEKPTV